MFRKCFEVPGEGIERQFTACYWQARLPYAGAHFPTLEIYLMQLLHLALTKGSPPR